MAAEPAVKRAMAFFDGQNVFRHAMKAFGHYHPNYDPVKLHHAVCEANGWTPNVVRFYTGIPDAVHEPMWAPTWSNRILAMKRSGIITTTRPIRYSSEEVEIYGVKKTITTPHEKGIDVRIALDIIKCARTEQFNVAVIFSQDQDLSEVVAEVKEISEKDDRWLKVACAFPDGPNASTRRGINNTQWCPIDEATYNACLDPRDYRPKKAAP